jgi:hypothetical protein
MQFLQFDLGQQPRGAVVEITLRGNAANVLLLDSSNFQSYKNGRRYNYHGGRVTRSPHRVAVPRSGRWYVVVDMGGYASHVDAWVSVLPGALTPARMA